MHGLYYQSLINWYQHFPSNQILVVNNARLVEYPWEVMTEIENLLGIPNEFSKKNFVKKRGMEDQGYCMTGGTIGDKVDCMGDGKHLVHPEVSEEALVILRKFYKESNHKFYQLIGENFGWPEE